MIDDLRRPWLNVVRRLQSAASKNRGAAILHTRIIVDETSNPIGWNEPEVLRIEPISRTSLLIDMIAPRPIHPLIAQVLDDFTLAINKGHQDGVQKHHWFAHICNDEPVAIFRVKELRERISILGVVWFDHGNGVLHNGDELCQLSWILPMDKQE